MLRRLHLTDIGPARELKFAFAPRLNILTGDNGLGKSFVLDIAWWVFTGQWSGERALPRRAGANDRGPTAPHISAVITTAGGDLPITGAYVSETQKWLQNATPTVNLVVYARIDGSFAIWDGYQASKDREDAFGGAAVVLDPDEVWNGKEDESRGKRRSTVCRGLLEDWVTWQGTGSDVFESLRRALAALSEPQDLLVPGPPIRVLLDDRRDIPTLEMPYGLVPVTTASAGQRRVLALAYMLVWAWTEHRRAATVKQRRPSSTMVVLVDEVELHLHPRWQRVLLPAILQAIATIAPDVSVQLLATTHAPLVLASLEPYFDEDCDDLYRFERSGSTVAAHRLDFAKQGDAGNWLVSETFGLDLPRSIPSEAAIEAASEFMRGDPAAAESALLHAMVGIDPLASDPSAPLKDRIHAALCRLLPGHDDFWPRWIVSNDPALSPRKDDP